MKMRQPPSGVVWIHVDRLDRADGKVWAVQYVERGHPVYLCVEAVILFTAGHTEFFGSKGKQPRAVIVVPGGIVDLRGTTAYIR